MSKLNPNPKQPPALDPNEERYWDARDLEGEMRRMLDICHNCRMCVGYCGTFPDVFARVDRDTEKHDASGAERLGADDFTSATDLCWQCKLCYVKCPYTRDEGHDWLVDIPRLLMREKAQRARRNGVTLQDRVLGEPQLLGKVTAGPLAPIANFVNANRLVRRAVEAVAGIAAEFPLPPFGTRTFESWLAHHDPLPWRRVARQGRALRHVPRRLQLSPHRGLRHARARTQRVVGDAAGADVLKFELPRPVADTIRAGQTAAALVVDHPAYTTRAELSRETMVSLAEDLRDA